MAGPGYSKAFTPRAGVLIISGLMFGPYGAIGAVLGNIFTDLLKGHGLGLMLTNAIVGGCVSYLAYKLWYNKFKSRQTVNKPRFNSTNNVILFLAIIVFCSILYVILERKFLFFASSHPLRSSLLIELRYFLSHVNASFIIGIVGIWISNRLDFIHVPETSTEKGNERIYCWAGIALVVITVAIAAIDYYFAPDAISSFIEIALLLALLFVYLRKPITVKIEETSLDSIPEIIVDTFLLATLIIAIFGFIVASDSFVSRFVMRALPMELEDISISIMVMMDVLIIIFFIPALSVIKYIEVTVVNPIVSFSRIEKFVKRGDKIESEGLVKVYSDYLDENSEIGMLARSYTNLIEYNNEYIENIRENEREKEKIKAELEIAENIQKSILPASSIACEDYSVYGFSKPARQVGGDFYDYYQLDEDNVAVIIGDASGKGVPAALLSTVTHSIIQQILERESDPSKALYSLNNQICDNNPNNTFITSWIGIYNSKSGILTYSNAGHNAPLIFDDGKFKVLKVESGIPLGIIEDYEFVNEQISISKGMMAYTDGITDARNSNKEFYGEDSLIDFLNANPFENKSITKLFDDIDEFTGSEEQFDDMTVLVLERHE